MVSVDRDNWGGNVHYRAAQIAAPETLEEAQRLVASSAKIRPLGTRHSFNRLPDTDGILIHLGSLPPDPVIDTDAMTVTVGGATRYGVVARQRPIGARPSGSASVQRRKGWPGSCSSSPAPHSPAPATPSWSGTR